MQYYFIARCTLNPSGGSMDTVVHHMSVAQITCTTTTTATNNNAICIAPCTSFVHNKPKLKTTETLK